MNKRVVGLLLAVILIGSVFAGCGGTKADKMTGNNSVAPDEKGYSDVYTGDNGAVDADAARSSTEAEAPAVFGEEQKNQGNVDSIAGGGNASQNVSNAILSERKVIRSANVTVEVENFDEAYTRIDTMILGIGFIQSTNINSEKYTVDNKQKLLRSGSIIIRVDREKFDKVLNSIKGIGEVLNWNINGEDVTDKYFDTESRLRLLRIEEGKLEEYLRKLNDLDQIFKTESRLTDIRYQIESLTGNLKKMTDLVELSTIAININEKRPGSDDPVKPKTYGQKLLDNFMDSMKGVISFVGEIIIILVAAIPVLVLLGVFILIALIIYRKIPNKGVSGQKGIKSAETKEKPDDRKNQ